MAKKMDDIRKKSDADLNKEVGKLREALKDFRFGITGSKIRNMREGRNLKKDIARHLTELSARTNATK